MDNLEFRKFITTYGISYEEYEKMEDSEKEEIISKFESETKTDNMDKLGKGLQGCGCLIILIPILLGLLFFLFSLIKNLF